MHVSRQRQEAATHKKMTEYWQGYAATSRTVNEEAPQKYTSLVALGWTIVAWPSHAPRVQHGSFDRRADAHTRSIHHH